MTEGLVSETYLRSRVRVFSFATSSSDTSLQRASSGQTRGRTFLLLCRSRDPNCSNSTARAVDRSIAATMPRIRTGTNFHYPSNLSKVFRNYKPLASQPKTRILTSILVAVRRKRRNELKA